MLLVPNMRSLWIVQDLDYKKCLYRQLNRTEYDKKTCCPLQLWKQEASFGKTISRIYDKSWSQSFNNASVMLCCMVRKANKDIIRGTEASYLMNKLDIYDTNKEKNQISNQNYQHLSSPRRKSALYFKGRWNMDLEGELSKYLLIFVFLDWNNQFVRIWHLKKITKKIFASNKDFDREQNRVKPWQFYNEQGQSR